MTSFLPMALRSSSSPASLARRRPLVARVTAALLGLAAAGPAAACGTCGCTLNADWPTQGLGNGLGWSAGLRHDFLVQDQLRRGTRAVDRASIPLPADDEVQQRTVNRTTTLTLDRALDDTWGATLVVPWVRRDHTTIDGGETDVSGSHSDSLGDVRVLARWVGLSASHDAGLQVGLKLPTGGTHVAFRSGPTAGEPLDRGLQPGTGTTDLLLGAFAFRELGRAFDGYGQVQVQRPLAARDGFRPGTVFAAIGGVRLAAEGPVVPHLQVDLRHETAESGPAADAPDSGGSSAWLSPGLTWRAGESWSVYGLAQVPVWQDVRGLQLEPRWVLTAGVQARF